MGPFGPIPPMIPMPPMPRSRPDQGIGPRAHFPAASWRVRTNPPARVPASWIRRAATNYRRLGRDLVWDKDR
jgi:hypothetical protein